MQNEKEIGGYFGLEKLISNEYYPDLAAVNNARCALLYIIKARHYKKSICLFFVRLGKACAGTRKDPL